MGQMRGIPFISGFKLDLAAGSGSGPSKNFLSISRGDHATHGFEMIESRQGEDRQQDIYRQQGMDQFEYLQGTDLDFGPVTVAGPCVQGKSRQDLLTVLNQWSTGTGARFNATLELLDKNQQVVKTISFHDCIPIEYQPPAVSAQSSSVLVETFTFKPRRVQAG